MFTLTSIITWAALALTAASAPASLTERDVVAPPITNPKAGTVWTVGATEKVEWDTSDLPPAANITNKQGMVVLGYLDDSDPDGGEHLDLDHPLAQGFPITQGSVTVTVPSVDARNDYIIVLFGDSGNLSPKFTIQLAIDNPSTSSGTATPSLTVTTHSSPSIPTSVTSPGGPISSTTDIPTTTSASATTSVIVTTATRTSTTVVSPTSGSSSTTAPPSSSSPTSISASGSSSRSSSASGTASASTSAAGVSSQAHTVAALVVGLVIATLAL